MTYPPGSHRSTHPTLVDGCFACRISTVQTTPSSMPSRGTGESVGQTVQREKQLHKDRDAYKRLRADGLQPSSVDGSAHVESGVKDQLEIDYKVAIPKSELPRLKEIQAEVVSNTTSTERAW